MFAVLLALAVFLLVPSAYASPPDPTWLQGLWDDSDHDDVVILVTEAGGTTVRCLDYDFRPVCLTRIEDSRNDRPLAVQVSSEHPRAPPA